jgi:signal transduction histidine kinase
MSSRLEHLYEISKLFASFENVEQTFDPALGIATKTLPLRSAILIETEDGRSKMIVWAAEGQKAEKMRAVKEHAEAAYTYLLGAPSTKALDLSEHVGMTALPRQTEAEEDPTKRFIVIPLVVANRPPFGVLQLEGAQPLEKKDLMFVSAVGNQLAIALDRDRAWRRDILRREHAEEERTHAEARGAAAERERIIAEGLREKYETLAGENAKLYEHAQQAVRVREQILAVVSHDLRDPLGSILMTTGALAKGGVVKDRHGVLPQALGNIQRAAERMRRLIEDLLDFASIEAGSLAIKRHLQDAGSMIQETLASFEGIARDRGLQVTAEVEPQLPKAYCDRDRILQVLSNLVGNATKVTPDGGHITVRVEEREHEFLFAVSDDGPGISEDDIKHLFERYWRSGDARYKGTGLGLAIARGIVIAHGGRIWVESKLGRGASFLFTVPAADDRRQTTRRSGEPLTPPSAATAFPTKPDPDDQAGTQGPGSFSIERLL